MKAREEGKEVAGPGGPFIRGFTLWKVIAPFILMPNHRNWCKHGKVTVNEGCLDD